MPVISIRALPQQPGVDRTAAMSNATQAVAAVLGIDPRRVWATWTEVVPALFVEGGVVAERQPQTSHPPLVDIVAFEGRPPELVERIVRAVVDALAEGLSLPTSNFFVTYTEAKSGRLWTGGALRR